VPDKEGLRPTPDRVRETIFNWLASDIPAARVLDCFAGAGGLGLEAASREAAEVILVEKDRRVANSLINQCERLGADNVTIETVDVLNLLDQYEQAFDVVFIDPPYAKPELHTQTIQKLIDRSLLNPDCKLYLEWPESEQMLLNDDNLTWVKQKTAGQIMYAIAQWHVTG